LVVIRLTRVGKKKQAHYRIVAADSRRAVQGKFISILGWYNPHTKEFEINQDELQSWLEKGAQPSNTLAKLLKKEGIKLPKWVKITEKKKASKKKEKEEAKEKPAPKAEEKKEESTDDTAEAPAEEVKKEKTEDKGEEKPEPDNKETEEDSKEEKKAEEKPKAKEDTKETDKS